MAGILSLCAAALVAWAGAEMGFAQGSFLELVIYAGLVIVLLGIAIYTVALDIRYTRLQYAVARRAAFLQTLGDESFRASLRGLGKDASTPAATSSPPDKPASMQEP